MWHYIMSYPGNNKSTAYLLTYELTFAALELGNAKNN